MTEQESKPSAAPVIEKGSIIETGSALISGAVFGLVGAVVGNRIGALGNSARHSLSGKVGGWIGGLTLGTISLYASFEKKRKSAETVDNLKQEVASLRAQLESEDAEKNYAPPKPGALPEQKAPAPNIHTVRYDAALERAAPHYEQQL